MDYPWGKDDPYWLFRQLRQIHVHYDMLHLAKISSTIFGVEFNLCAQKISFSKVKWHNFFKFHLTMTKLQLGLYFLVKYLHMHFQPYKYIPTKVKEQKLKISYFFLSSRGMTVKNHQTMTNLNLNLTCIFLWSIHCQMWVKFVQPPTYHIIICSVGNTDLYLVMLVNITVLDMFRWNTIFASQVPN
jgi:hypothetical protein